jgi:hypothetical protein
MRKRTRIGVVAAALLFGVVAPTVVGAAGNDGLVLASALHGGVNIAERAAQSARWVLTGIPPVDPSDVAAVTRRLEATIPDAAQSPTGRTALTDEQRLKLMHVACKVNEAHDFAHEYRIDELLRTLDPQVPGAVRVRDSVLDLSSDIADAKEDADLAYEVGSEVFCEEVKYQVEQQA